VNSGFNEYNAEEISQTDMVMEIVAWFPNFWVRNLFVIKTKELIILGYRDQM